MENILGATVILLYLTFLGIFTLWPLWLVLACFWLVLKFFKILRLHWGV